MTASEPYDFELDSGSGPQALPRGTPGMPRTIPADSIPTSVLDQDALRVISRLQRHGFEAYLTGGCVRDLLIGRIPKDFDVATSAHPRQIKRLFRNGRIIGRRFRLVHIYYGEHIVETATFRCEREIEGDTDPMPASQDGGPNGEGPGPERGARLDEEELDELLITEDNEYGTAEQDARRRDFTVNALFLDPTRGVILDYVGGLDDLEAGLLRTIGDPMVRLAEDPVRILRAIKFATRLGLRIEDRTWAAMCALRGRLTRSAPPRVFEEILRLLRSGTALGALRMLRACGALEVILPTVDAYLGDKDDVAAKDRAEGFWRLLEALDADVHTGYVPSTAVCIALLHLKMIECQAEPATRTFPGAAPDLFAVTGEVLEPFAIATRIARRDTARARRLVFQQRRFTQASNKRFRPLLFVRSEEFPEALELFRLRTAARGQGWDIYEGWRARLDLALKLPPEEVALERRRARRRPRRRRRGGGGPESDGGDAG